ncbi:MAG: TonB-dependent receptor [Ferruginibacter sp.]
MKKIFLSLLCFTVFFINAQTINDSSQRARDTLQTTTLQEVTFTASRITESILVSPVSVQKLNSKGISLSPALSFFDALEHVQGVQMITPSLGFKVLNARGFANTTNVRFAQLTDGMDMASPHIGGAIGNSLGPTDLDIDNAEILPGTASALYGINTVNGLANFITRNPFTSEGFSIQQKSAVNHVNDNNSKAKLFSETTFRYAKVLSSKWAFKINGAFTKGYDWIASDQTELNANANSSTNLFGADNPAQDRVSSYGNESSDRKTITLGGKKYVVSRTGYDEKNVVDYGLENIKGDAGIYYKLTKDATIIYSYHFSLLNNVYQRANRFRLQDYLVQQHGLQYQSKAIQAKLYMNNENTGKSYNLRSMAENLDRSYKPDNTWYGNFTSGYNQAVGNGATVSDALKEARAAADAGRYLPGTPAFDNQLKKLQNINNWDSGAALRVRAGFIHAEAQINLTEQALHFLKQQYDIDLLVGADHRTYIIVPDGNYFVNPVTGKQNDNIHYSKTGGFISVSKGFLQKKIKVGAVIRTDKSDYFSATFNPRITAVYSPSHDHNFRMTFQSGYRFPSIFEAYSNVNSGGVKRVGGLPVMSSGIFENAWLANSITVFQQAVLTDINTNGLTQNAAIEKNKHLLKKNTYSYVKPEYTQTWEVGYKGLFLDKKLYVNADIYLSRFRNFIAQANMNVPNTKNADSISSYLNDKSKQASYRMYTNSKSVISNYGFSAGINYQLKNTWIMMANTTFAKLKNAENEDGLEDGFNTPEWMLNVSISKKNIAKNVDATLAYRWQTSYYSQTFLATGNVSSYNTLDAQVTFQLPEIKSSIKIGGSNFLNHYYISYLGGPSVGAMYYVAIAYGISN